MVNFLVYGMFLETFVVILYCFLLFNMLVNCQRITSIEAILSTFFKVLKRVIVLITNYEYKIVIIIVFWENTRVSKTYERDANE